MSVLSFVVNVFKGSMRAAARRTAVNAGAKVVLGGVQTLAKGVVRPSHPVNDFLFSPHAETVVKAVAGATILNHDRFAGSDLALELGSESLVQSATGAQQAIVDKLITKLVPTPPVDGEPIVTLK